MTTDRIPRGIVEDWVNARCSACSAHNWFYTGHWDRENGSGLDCDGVICHACKAKWLLVDEKDIDYIDDPSNPVFEEGQARPTGVTT